MPDRWPFLYMSGEETLVEEGRTTMNWHKWTTDQKIASGTTGLIALIVFLVLATPLTAMAQVSPSIVGRWTVSIKATKSDTTLWGNKVQDFMGSGGDMRCSQSGSVVICRGEGSSILEGTLSGAYLVLDGEWRVKDSSSMVNCFYYTCIVSGGTTSPFKVHFEGSLISDDLIEGTWTALLIDWPFRFGANGTWRAIKN